MNRTRVNERIVASKLILILANGEKFGETSKMNAIEMARKEGLDLVEVSSGPTPICKICDFGKMQYERSKQEKHHQHAPSLKEVRISYTIEEHDLLRQKKKIADFLDDGHRVQLVMRTRGRERFAGHGAAKEKFVSIVRELVPLAKIADLQENEKGYSFMLCPSAR